MNTKQFKHVVFVLVGYMVMGAIMLGVVASCTALLGSMSTRGIGTINGRPATPGETILVGIVVGALLGGAGAVSQLWEEWKRERAQKQQVVTPRSSRPSRSSAQPTPHKKLKTVRYTDIGPAVGTCSTCGREVYAVPGSVTVMLVMSDQEDKVKATAMWCPKCNALYCMGCARSSNRKCPACGVDVVDHYDR